MAYISADAGSRYGHDMFNTCFVNAIVLSLTSLGISVRDDSVEALIRHLRGSRNGEYMSPLDDTYSANGRMPMREAHTSLDLAPVLNPHVERFIDVHRAGMELYVDGNRKAAFPGPRADAAIIRLNLVRYEHWEVLVDRGAYENTKALCKQEVSDREFAARLVSST
jgi:hypothetical protein